MMESIGDAGSIIGVIDDVVVRTTSALRRLKIDGG